MSDGAPISLELYKAEGSTWRLVDSSSTEASAYVATRPNGTHLYRVEVSGPLSVLIRVTLSCLADCHDQCAATRQPGDACSAASRSCDDGLYCRRLPGACEAPAPEGRCRKIPKTCDFRWAPVCGCDGLTYASSCLAENHRMSIADDGECEGHAIAP